MGNKKTLFWSKTENLMGLALMFGLLLPHTSTAFMLVNPILFVMFILMKRRKNFCKYGLLPIIAIVVSLLLNMAGAATGKSFMMAVAIILCIVAFPIADNAKIKNIYIYLAFAAIFLSQVAYMFNIGYVASFVDTYYPISWGENFIVRTNENVDITNYLDYRQGGLYRNPNQLAKYVTFLLAIYLVNNNKKTIKKQIWFIALCLFSIVLTGSRTGFVVSSILFLLSAFSNKRLTRTRRNIVTIVFLGLIIYYALSGFGGRSTAVEAGLQDSLGAKFWLVIDYLTHEVSALAYLFGHLDYTLFEGSYYTTYNLDCEYGYIIYCFGFIGFFAFVSFFYKIYRRVDKHNRFFFVVCLWMISSTIIMSYRALFVFMLLLSTIYNKPSNMPEAKR